MKLKTNVLILLILTISTQCDIIDVVVSFVTTQGKPTSVLMPHSCWTKYKTLSLAKTLNEHGMNLALSLQPNASEYYLHHIIAVVDLACPGSDTLLLWASAHSYFRSPFRWLFIEGGDSSLETLKDLEMLVDSDVVIAKRINDQEFTLTEVYRISAHSELIYTARGIWRAPANKKNIFTNSTPENTRTEIMIWNNENSKRNVKDLVTANQYGVIEDLRTNTVLSARRRNLRRHTLTMVNVITDSNETRKHMDDRL